MKMTFQVRILCTFFRHVCSNTHDRLYTSTKCCIVIRQTNRLTRNLLKETECEKKIYCQGNSK